MDIPIRRREQEVWQACDDLWALHGEFKLLTGDAIRERLVNLGKSRGSPNEIYKYRKTWVENRNISAQEHEKKPQEHDPISRVVKLVHENLHAETQEKIDAFRSDFEEQINTREQEIKRIQEHYDQLIEEYQKLKINLDQTQENYQTSLKKLEAETSIRISVEQQLRLSQSNLNIIKQEKTEFINSQEKHHKEEIVNLTSNLKLQQENFSNIINSFEQEKKLMGQEYSEELIKLKTKIYNLEIVCENHEKFKQENLIQTQKSQEDIKKSQINLNNLEQENKILQIKFQEKNNILEKLENNNKYLALELKKSQLKLARFRAIWSRI